MVLRRRALAAVSVVVALPGYAFGDSFSGLLGTIDTPGAFAWDVDDLLIGLDAREDARVLSFGFQATERLQIGLAFPNYEDGGGPSSGNELSLAYRVLNETEFTPSLSVGLVGLGNDDRGAGEYVIAGKTIGPVQAAVGLGWGRYASPFDGVRGDGADKSFAIDQLFAGDSAGFANLRWETPVEGLSLLAEYADIAQEGEDATFAAGLRYELTQGLSIAAYANNIDDVGLRFTFAANPNEPYIPQNISRGPQPYVELGTAPLPDLTAEQVLALLQERLEKENIRVVRFAMNAESVDVMVATPDDINIAWVAGRTARVLSAIAPARITTFRISRTSPIFDTQVVTLDRAGLDEAVGEPDAGVRSWAATTIEAAPLSWPDTLIEPEFTGGFSYDFATSFKADFLTSDDLQATGTVFAVGRYDIARGTQVSGSLGYRFLNQWEQSDPPDEPAVRTDITAYTPDEVFLNALTLRHKFRLTDTVYSRVSLGLFERQYGGVSAEVLWRPPAQDFALGVEATYVQKRDYEDLFALQDTNATTLIGSVYANVGEMGNFIELDAGRYLAEDFGVGLTFGRNFPNGWRIAANTAWSDESDDALKFGAELQIPLGWTAPDVGTRRITIGLGGPSGDFAARVFGTGLLYPDIRSSDRQQIKDQWGQFWN
ncbi:MAG: YjbH domain-containing protein [Pseudomonadota bacterium]